MLKKLLAVTLGLFSVSVFANPNLKENSHITQKFPCYDTKDLFSVLKKEYKEYPTALGIANETVVFSFWVEKHKKTWTLIATETESGRSCVISVGEKYETFALPKGKEM